MAPYQCQHDIQWLPMLGFHHFHSPVEWNSIKDTRVNFSGVVLHSVGCRFNQPLIFWRKDWIFYQRSEFWSGHWKIQFRSQTTKHRLIDQVMVYSNITLGPHELEPLQGNSLKILLQWTLWKWICGFKQFLTLFRITTWMSGKQGSSQLSTRRKDSSFSKYL